jgi:hypothetical protein
MTNLPESHAVVQLAESLQLPEDLRQQLTQLLKDFPQSSVALGQLLSHFSRVVSIVSFY